MVDRRDVGSWLQGPDSVQHRKAGEYPGAELGLPEHGPGSVATLGPRVVALVIDWAFCSLLAAGLLGYRWGEPGANSFLPLWVFIAENVLLVGLFGTTLGHRVMGLGVLAINRKPAGLLRATIRTVLLALVIPAVVWDNDQRGLHDRLASTMIIRVR